LSVAHVVHVLGTGDKHARGIALTVMNLAETMDTSRYRLSVIFLRGDGAIGDHLRALGVNVRAIGWHRGRADIRGALRFAHALRSLRPDIVHLHAGGLSPRFVSKVAAGAKVIMHYHSLEEESQKSRGPRRTPIAADLIVVNSEATAQSVRRARSVVVYPGVHANASTHVRDRSQRVTVGVAARLAPVKGLEYLIEAVKALDNVHLVIAGDGPEKDRLENLVRHESLEDRVTFTGWLDDIGRTMSQWDIYAQPSVAEGLGIAALEAMSLGIPVVASDVGGLREIVVSGETGFLVPPRDSAQLAAHLKELACNAELRRKMGEAARARAIEKFSRERESQALQSAYAKLLD
jgi:glycosyltransferase involved in cell wall biosynthesis